MGAEIVERLAAELGEKMFGEPVSVHRAIYETIPRDYSIPDVTVSIGLISSVPDKTNVLVYGYMDEVRLKNVNSSKISVIEGLLYRDGHRITVKWTVAKSKASKVLYVLKKKLQQAKLPGRPQSLVQVSGKVSSFSPVPGKVVKSIQAKDLVPMGEGKGESSLYPEPKYSLGKGVVYSDIRRFVDALLSEYQNVDKSSFMPEEIEREFGMQPLKKSLRFVHGRAPVPREKLENFLEYDGFRRRILAEKVWATVKASEERRSAELPSDISISKRDIEEIKRIVSSLPFELTSDQKKALWGILKRAEELGASRSLLFGDVGTGKTIVSLIAARIFSLKGFQSAVMAPTSILAKQHYEEAVSILGEDLVCLVHSKTKASEKREIQNRLADGEPLIVYGTTSLNSLSFSNLGLIVVDEEQKFGVEDKEKLYKKHFPAAHMLFMTATPLPRTLTAAIFSDFRAFHIKEKPKVQKPRYTVCLNPDEPMDPAMHGYIVRSVENGEQALVIVPSILSAESVNTEAARIKYSQMFPGFSIETVHGQMDQKEVESIMERFISGDFDMLIATTMVDAGFSNKNLSFVFIENPERFGVAQMHQIRGRVGRGDKQGYCFLCPIRPIYALKESTRERINSLIRSEDGFYLSSVDMQMRGTGDLLGTAQSRGEINLLEWEPEIKRMREVLRSRQGV